MTAISTELLSIWNELISANNLTNLQAALKRGDISTKDKLGEEKLSPLHLAAWHDCPDICRFLIENGITPDAKEEFSGKTPLHIAVHLGNVQSCITLIENGAEALISKKSVDHLSCHPIHYACVNDNRDMIDFFLKFPKLDSTRTTQACSIEKLSHLGNILDILIRQKNHKLLEYYSPIGRPHAVETNPKIYSTLYIGYSHEHQWTPFHFAAVLGDCEAIQLLLLNFPHASCLNEKFKHHYFFSPGEVALAEGHIEAAKLLGNKNKIEDFRESMKIYSLEKKAPDYASSLANAIIDRDDKVIDSLIQNYGAEILSKKFFKTDGTDPYKQSFEINAYSIACRSFCFNFLSKLTEKEIKIPEKEFQALTHRDIVEVPFFNWTLIDIHPLGMGFFLKLKKLIGNMDSK